MGFQVVLKVWSLMKSRCVFYLEESKVYKLKNENDAIAF